MIQSPDLVSGRPPTGVAALGRISQLTKEFDDAGNRVSKSEAYHIVADELS